MVPNEPLREWARTEYWGSQRYPVLDLGPILRLRQTLGALTAFSGESTGPVCDLLRLHVFDPVPPSVDVGADDANCPTRRATRIVPNNTPIMASTVANDRATSDTGVMSPYPRVVSVT